LTALSQKKHKKAIFLLARSLFPEMIMAGPIPSNGLMEMLEIGC
jgi:hypothetical protein